MRSSEGFEHNLMGDSSLVAQKTTAVTVMSAAPTAVCARRTKRVGGPREKIVVVVEKE